MNYRGCRVRPRRKRSSAAFQQLAFTKSGTDRLAPHVFKGLARRFIKRRKTGRISYILSTLGWTVARRVFDAPRHSCLLDQQHSRSP